MQTEYSYEPFGKTTQSGATSSNPTQYTSRENDGTGLYYYRARYYSPSLQRFISEDPAGFVDGYNLYEYVKNSPVNLTDPSGEFASMLPGTLPFPGIPPFPRIPWPWLVGAAVVIVVVIAIIYVCDIPIPIRIPRAIPFPDLDRRGKSTWTCIVRCHINNFGNIPNAPAFVEATATGPDEASAEFAAMRAAQGMSPPDTYTRHCRKVRCWRN